MLENNLEAVARHMLIFSLALEEPEKMGLQGQLQGPRHSGPQWLFPTPQGFWHFNGAITPLDHSCLFYYSLIHLIVSEPQLYPPVQWG